MGATTKKAETMLDLFIKKIINLSLFTHPNVVPDPYGVIFSVQFKRRNFLKNRFSPIISVVPYTKLSYEFTKHMNNFYNTFLLFSFGPGHYEPLLWQQL